MAGLTTSAETTKKRRAGEAIRVNAPPLCKLAAPRRSPEMSTAFPPRVRVYGPSPWIILLFWGLFGPMALFFVATLFIPGAREAGYFLAPFGVLIAFSVQWFLSRTRLELSPDGIRSRSPGQTVETSWANVSGVRLGGMQPGFTTNEPMNGKGAHRLAAYSGLTMNGAPMYDSETRAWVEARRFIPLKPFGWHLKHGDLVGEVGRLAPQVHLQEALVAARQPKPAGAARTGDTRATWLIVLGSVLLAGGFVALIVHFPKMGHHLYALLLCLAFPILALQTFLAALSMFRKRAIFMGILLVLLSMVWLLSTFAPLGALLS